MTSVPTVTLNTGAEIPQLGFGVFQIPPGDAVEAVSRALTAGYRHIDTAEMYGNEREVGEAVARSGLDRSEVFVTSKLNNSMHGFDDALHAFDATLEKLGTDTIDLFLIHWPLAMVCDFVPTWKALEQVHAEGRARSIGVSNFQIHHLERLFAETGVIPAVNQIEGHPYLVQDELRSFDAEHGIATEAWSPIAQGAVLEDPTVTEIAGRLERTPSQVVLRWHVQLGNIVFPKSVTPSRIEENFALWDFSLDPDDMAAISGLDRGERTGPDPDTFDMVPD
jgi:2,5-diketo-D-gluconate reductase A